MPDYARRQRKRRKRKKQVIQADRQAAQVPQPIEETNTLAYLQRTIGNHATLELIRSGQISPDGTISRQVIQRQGGGTGTLTEEEKQKQTRENAEKSWGGWAYYKASDALSYGNSWVEWMKGGKPEDQGPEDSNLKGEGDGMIPGYGKDTEGKVSGTMEGMSLPTMGSEEDTEKIGEELEKEDPESPLSLDQITIDLGRSTEFESGNETLGKVGMGGKVSKSLSGKTTYTGKLSSEGQYGIGEAEGKYESTPEKIAGEGKVSFLYGSKAESEEFEWKSSGESLVGKGQVEGKYGTGVEASGKFENSKEKLAMQGKMSAFTGVSTEFKGKIILKAEGEEIATFGGSGGLTLGLGGELKGSIEFEGGKITIYSAGKLSAGLGFTYGYTVSIDTMGLIKAGMSKASGWFTNWMWGSKEPDPNNP